MFVLPSDPNPLSGLLSSAIGGAQAHGKQQVQQNELQRVLGGLNAESSPIDWFKAIESTRDPELKRELREGYKQHLEGQKVQALQQKAQPNQAQIDKDFATVEKYLGPEVAELYSTATPGGKTQLLKQAIEAQQRGGSLGEKLRKGTQPGEETERSEEREWPEINPPSDLLGREKVKWRADNKKDNGPVYKQSRDRLRAFQSDKSDFSHIKRLIPQLPEGWGRAIINPTTGEPWSVVQWAGKVPAPVQEVQKILSRQFGKAKEFFPGRVTNFDLETYMKQFPGLLNSKEGSEKIVELLMLDREVNEAYEKALVDVYDHYGVDNIPQQQAERLAHERVEPYLDEFEQRRIAIDQIAGAETGNEAGAQEDITKASQDQINEAKRSLRPGYTLMMKPDGKHVAVKNDQVAQREKQNYRKL